MIQLYAKNGSKGAASDTAVRQEWVKENADGIIARLEWVREAADDTAVRQE